MFLCFATLLALVPWYLFIFVYNAAPRQEHSTAGEVLLSLEEDSTKELFAGQALQEACGSAGCSECAGKRQEWGEDWDHFSAAYVRQNLVGATVL